MSSRLSVFLNLLVILSLLINLIPAPGVAQAKAPDSVAETAARDQPGGRLPPPAAPAGVQRVKPAIWLPIFITNSEYRITNHESRITNHEYFAPGAGRG